MQKRNMWIGIGAALFTIATCVGRFGDPMANVFAGQFAVILVAVGGIITARLRTQAF